MSSTNTQSSLVEIQVEHVILEGELTIPAAAQGIVVFVHGSGSSRHSPRNQYVAREMQDGGLATLLFDLLTAEEEQVDLETRELRFDIGLLARRTTGAVEWLARQPHTAGLSIGLFGASTGAAAALIAATYKPDLVRAVVSRGGRPDLAGEALSHVQVPTLLLVGGEDDIVILLNKEALEKMPPEGATKRMRIIPGASHLFEEPGTLEQAARLARDWFQEVFQHA